MAFPRKIFIKDKSKKFGGRHWFYLGFVNYRSRNFDKG